jgi:protein ImuA
MALVRSNLRSPFREARDARAPSLRAAFSVMRGEAKGLKAASKTASRIAALRQAVAKLERGQAAGTPTQMPLGLIDIDRLLPGAGLACGALHEVAAAAGERPAALGFAVALAASAMGRRRGPALLVASRRSLSDLGSLYGHGLEGLGLDAGRLILVETRSDKDALWALEETLKSKAGPAVVLGAIAGHPGLTPSRRLSLAAALSATPLLLLLPFSPAKDASAAVTRWRISAAGRGRFASAKDLARPAWSVALERCRNGRTGQWLIEWDHVALRFRLAESVADCAPHAGGEKGSRRLAG